MADDDTNAPRRLWLPGSTDDTIKNEVLEEREIRVNLDTNRVHLGDGATPGGHVFATAAEVDAAADDVADLVTEASEAADRAEAARDDVSSTQIAFPSDDLFTFVDAEEKVVARIDKSGTAHFADIELPQEEAKTRRARFYTFNGSTEVLAGFEGTDGYAFPTDLGVTITGLPAGCTVRDPDVFYDAAVGRYWCAFSAFGFGTGQQAAQFGIATSTDGVHFVFVTLISIYDIPDPDGSANKPDRAWAPQWVFPAEGWIGIIVSTFYGTIDVNGSGHERMVPIILRMTRPDMKAAKYAGRFSGSKIPFNCIDVVVILTNGIYMGVFKNEGTRDLHALWSTDLFQGWDNEGSTATQGWGIPNEGPSLVPWGDGSIRSYYDRYDGSGMFSRSTLDNGVTWGAETPLVAAIERHGSVILLNGD